MSDNYPVTEYTLNLSTSVTKDEAVAKMLGLLRGAVRSPKFNSINTDLKYQPELNFDLSDYLENIREKAVDRAVTVFDDSSSNDDQKANAYYEILRCDRLISKAHEYLAAIDFELSNAETALLKLDLAHSNANGEEYIYLASLDNWVKQKYSFSIYPDSSLNVINPEIESIPFENSQIVETVIMDDIEHDYEVRAKSVNAIREWVKSNKKGGYSDKETKNLLTTFFVALLDDPRFFGTNPPKSLKELASSINVSGTAEKLANRIITEFGEVTGQKQETIKLRIEHAKREFIEKVIK
jgi:hypothetical protein